MPQVTGTLYAIFRVSEKKYYNATQISGYQKHAEREVYVPNADPNVENERLIGTADIVGDVKRFMEGCKLRKDSVWARELLFTASKSFFKDLTEEGKREWVNQNLKFMEEYFGENIIYSTLHKDESTWHISSLLVPKFFSENKQTYILSNKRYFDGKKKMSEWQDRYHAAIYEKFKNLHRGIKFSKAKHVQIRTYYALINAKINENNLESICAKAKNSELLEKQVRSLQNTLNSYSKIFENKNNDIKSGFLINNELKEQLDNVKVDREVYKKTIKAVSELYKISQRDIYKIITTVEKNIENDNSKTLEIKIYEK